VNSSACFANFLSVLRYFLEKSALFRTSAVAFHWMSKTGYRQDFFFSAKE